MEIERLERAVLEAQRGLEDAQIDVKQALAVCYAVGGLWAVIATLGVIFDLAILAALIVPLVLTIGLIAAISEDDPWLLRRNRRRVLEDAEFYLNRAYMKGNL